MGHAFGRQGVRAGLCGAPAQAGDDQLDALEVVDRAAVGRVAGHDPAGQLRRIRVEQHDMREAARAHRVEALLPGGEGRFAVDHDEHGERLLRLPAFAARIGADDAQARQRGRR